ncbi:MAG: hypothetical protein LRY27_04650, partial [Chitinophagales bacterium]|nr:hypothetical protein [Chitinophagales bacterium]
IIPYSSVNELNYLRGAAFTYQLKNFYFAPFVSYKKVDANLSYTDTLNTDIETNRIQLSGYHRTETEMQNKHAIAELKAGGNVQYKTRSWHIGANVLYNHYSQPLTFETDLYNQFQFQGKDLLNASIDYHFLYKSLHFFGETAMSSSKNQTGFATLNGLLFNPGKTVDASLVYRNYSPKYQTMQYTNAFAESTLLTMNKAFILVCK